MEKVIRVSGKTLQDTGEEKINSLVETAHKKECRNVTKSKGNWFSKLLFYNSKPTKKTRILEIAKDSQSKHKEKYFILMEK